MDKKLTDSEIVNCFEWVKNCNDDLLVDCFGCPLQEHFPLCQEALIDISFHEINRQKAENERLKEEAKTIRAYIHDNGLEWDLLSYSKIKTNDWLIKGISAEQLEQEKIQAWKAEAYKECIEKVNERLAVHSFTSNSTEYTDGMLGCMEWVDSKIEELKKELVGEDNESTIIQ